VLQGILPIEQSRVSAEVLVGFMLAAIGIPAVLGYAKIAGMPLVTGLYTAPRLEQRGRLVQPAGHLFEGGDPPPGAAAAQWPSRVRW
jgi:hypothetical protein